MRGVRSVLAGVLLALFPALAEAACSDPPGPGVDWRRCVMHKRAFPQADLTGAQLKDGRFTRGDFTEAKMAGLDGRRAKFIDAAMAGADLTRARLSGADFTKADLSGARLAGADLRFVQFPGAVLRGVDLTGARTEGLNLLDADLSGATWVDGKTVCAEGSRSSCRAG